MPHPLARVQLHGLNDVLIAFQAPLYTDGEQVKHRVASASIFSSSEKDALLCDDFSQSGVKARYQNLEKNNVCNMKKSFLSELLHNLLCVVCIYLLQD